LHPASSRNRAQITPPFFGENREREVFFMQENSKKNMRESLHRDVAVFGNLRALCVAAVLAAMSLVLGKFLQIPNPFQEVIRLSFENLPILFAGITMGPLVGALVGTVADLLGCALYGYAINPIITLGGAAVGFLSGVVAHYVIKEHLLIKIIASAAVAHLAGSVVIKSLGLAAWYLGSYNMGLAELMLWRLLTYGIIATCEILLLYVLLRHKALKKQIERMIA
jgi:ECF transporter S component (folate family)